MGGDSQAIPKSRNIQNGSTARHFAAIEGRYPMPSQVNTIYSMGKGEPTIPGPLGWPKFNNNTSNAGIGRNYGMGAHGSAAIETGKPSSYQNIPKLGKTQMASLTPEHSQVGISSRHQNSFDNRVEPNRLSLVHLSPEGAYSSSLEKHNPEGPKNASLMVGRVVPDTLSTRNRY